MEIIILNSSVQFKNPILGQPSVACKDHYNGRSIRASIDGKEGLYWFDKEELPFAVNINEMTAAIKKKVEEKGNDES